MGIAYRCEKNPLILPGDVIPSQDNFRVEGVFNCGVAKYKDEIILLCRVAESVQNDNLEQVLIPMIKEQSGIEIVETIVIKKKEHPDYDYSDSRSVWKINENGTKNIQYLTSLSHFRIARSKDGIHFTISDRPDVFPNVEDSWGIEDPRITQIGDDYYITYTTVSEYGTATGLMVTKDFYSFERKGIIFAPENKDVTIFPEKINGFYYAFNRPVPKAIGNPDIWLAKSPDLLHWGGQKHFLGVTEECEWISGRIGGGAVPIKTERGWLVIYHAADKENRYCLGAVLCDSNDPSILIANSKEPIMEPEAAYEKEGFFGNTVFTCGGLLEGDKLIIYYGAADDKICRADILLSDIYKELGVL
ncbi:MAG: glycoside hydrolase family 130 protein [Herbinix sp.]|nr:glycoside hydrolase family 130 protein [Herbinix sp.]